MGIVFSGNVIHTTFNLKVELPKLFGSTWGLM
jgi:hypothetical protein